jgi:TatD DNase family protein
MQTPSRVKLIDIGVNLAHASFRNDRAEVVDRAAAAGVAAMVITGTSERTSREAQAIAQRMPGALHATAGVHPHHAKECTPATLDALRALAAMPGVVAIGECGLDYNRDFSPRPVQDRWFEAQLALAADLGLPVFLHERDAHDRFIAILREHRGRIRAAVIHCFTGSDKELDAYLDLDMHVGITGWICDERRGVHLRRLAPRIPEDRLMLETDAPFLVPRQMKPRPSRNEPAFLPHVLEAVASACGRPVEEVARATTAAACAFFRISVSA